MVAEVMLLLKLALVPEPQELSAGDGALKVEGPICVVVDRSASKEDRFTAQYLAQCLTKEHKLVVEVLDAPKPGALPIYLSRGKELPAQGYRLTIAGQEIRIEGADAAGVYYATQTLRQCFRTDATGLNLPRLSIKDWPDLKYRAMHYDTKHHQDKREYVEDLIRDLASYKANVLVWEWEDKFAYEKHPEIGAPGAFTKTQMQELTRFAAAHHVQIVPLVQGLGHVSFILKHPQYRPLREVADSAWQFCPLKDGSYQLLFDLWDEAIDATPGSEFMHIGCDETYELGVGAECGCKAFADKSGKHALMQMFLKKCIEHVESRGRKAQAWTDHESPDRHPWIYTPNPGIEPLWLPYFPNVQSSMWRRELGDARPGSFAATSQTITQAITDHSTEGSITTSWDDSGLHILAWMPRFICAAEYSWKGNGRDLDTWLKRFYVSYYGDQAADMRELYEDMQQSALFWYDTLQRRVWHWGEIGKMHLPDLPRDDYEFSGYWRVQYRDLLVTAMQESQRLTRELAIIDDNLKGDIQHRYDLEVMRTCVRLMQHNAGTFLMLADLEEELGAGSNEHFKDRPAALARLKKAQSLIQANLAERAQVYNELVAKWDETRLPKGLSLPDKPFVHHRDRARHFANRTADMSYLILDEQLLDMEGYLTRLNTFIANYQANLK